MAVENGVSMSTFVETISGILALMCGGFLFMLGAIGKLWGRVNSDRDKAAKSNTDALKMFATKDDQERLEQRLTEEIRRSEDRSKEFVKNTAEKVASDLTTVIQKHEMRMRETMLNAIVNRPPVKEIPSDSI